MIFKIKKGDRLPALKVQLTENGSPINLTGYTVKFLMSLPGVLAKVAAAPTIDDIDEGIVSYHWGATDTDTKATYRSEWELTDGSGLKRTIPNEGYDYVEVWDDLG